MMLAGLVLCCLHTLGIVAWIELSNSAAVASCPPHPLGSQVTSADASRCPQDFLGRYAGCQARQDIKAMLSGLADRSHF